MAVGGGGNLLSRASVGFQAKDVRPSTSLEIERRLVRCHGSQLFPFSSFGAVMEGDFALVRFDLAG